MKIAAFSLAVLFLSCSSSDNDYTAYQPTPQKTTLKYLALGDSYTIGQNVCETCRFPEQLKSAVQSNMPEANLDLDIIAATGWTTTNLWAAIENQQPSAVYDLVTLLIGVNNQYMHLPFTTYEEEFPKLLDKAIQLAKGDASNVIAISIPDYSYTPFGQVTSDPGLISTEIDQYNAFAEEYCETHGVTFVNITDITRQGLEDIELVATDGLHPSDKAYAAFIGRILPKALLSLK